MAAILLCRRFFCSNLYVINVCMVTGWTLMEHVSMLHYGLNLAPTPLNFLAEEATVF